MVRFIFRAVVSVALMAVVVTAVAPAVAAHPATEYVEGEVIVTFREGADLPNTKQRLDHHALTLVKHFGALSAYRHRQTVLARGPGRTTAALIAELQQEAAVETVEPNYLRWVTSAPPTNDTFFAELWGLQNNGQVVNGASGAAGDDIRFIGAWQAAHPATDSVVVAVIDTGVDYHHPDLVANMWTNPGEVPGNGVDDDGNGYVDDYYGYDFLDGVPDPMDSGFHGTHVSGTIAATGNNHLGVIGVNYQARIMALRASNDGLTVSDAAAIEAIQYATMMKNRGVNVVAINASFGGGGSSAAERAAIQAAGDAGLVFCAAAGNDTNDNDRTPTYPAGYRLPNMIVVAASDQNDALASFSDYGATTVDLAAPGVNILSTIPIAVGGTTASVQQAAISYAANGLAYAGVTTGLTATVYDCGFGYPAEFPAAVNGAIALIERGAPPGQPPFYFTDKVSNAMAAGAQAAIIYNNTNGNFNGTLQRAGNWIPAVSISQADGAALLSQLPLTVTVVNAADPSLIYEYADGTSMATPHVAGAVAFAAMNDPSETVSQRIQRVLANVDPVAVLQGKVVTGGRLNLQRIATGTPATAVRITVGPTVTNALLNLADEVVVAAGAPAAFWVAATATNGELLTYQWAFGDGTGSHESAPWHTYDAGTCGTYTTTVVIADGITAAATRTLNVAVPCQLTITKMQVHSNFAKPRSDSCTLTATFVPGADFHPANQPVTVDIGGARVQFTLSKNGHGTSTNGTCVVSYSPRNGERITLSLRNGAWHDAWIAHGLFNQTIKRGVPVQIPVVVVIHNDAYAADRTLTYTATAGKTGAAK